MGFVTLRLQQHGKSNKPLWWIVAQSSRRSVDGPVIEKLGTWMPRNNKLLDRSFTINKERIIYWLAVGAQPSDKVHSILHKLDILPKKPSPFGNSSILPERGFHERKVKFDDKTFDYVKAVNSGEVKSKEEYYNKKTQEMENAIKMTVEEYKDMLKIALASSEVVDPEIETDGLDSDEADFFIRKRNFSIIKHKLDSHIKETRTTGGDLKYNTYIRKLDKLSKDGQLDEEAWMNFKLIQREHYKETKETELTYKLADKLPETEWKGEIKKDLSQLMSALYERFNQTSPSFLKEDQELEEITELHRKLLTLKTVKMIQYSLADINTKLGNEKDAKILIDKANSFKEYHLEDLEKTIFGNEKAISLSEEEDYERELFSSFTKSLLTEDTLHSYRKYVPTKEQNENDLLSIKDDALEQRIMALETLMADRSKMNLIKDEEFTDISEINIRNIDQARKEVRKVQEAYSKAVLSDSHAAKYRIKECEEKMGEIFEKFKEFNDFKKWHVKGLKLRNKKNFFDNPEDEMKLTQYLTYRFLKMRRPKFESHIEKKGKLAFLYFSSKIGETVLYDRDNKRTPFYKPFRYRRGRFPLKQLLRPWKKNNRHMGHVWRLKQAQSNVDELLDHQEKRIKMFEKKLNERIRAYFGNIAAVIYPEGFRNLENLEKYRKNDPHATASDYIETLSAFCDFETYKQLYFGSMENLKKICILSLEFPGLEDMMPYFAVYLKSKRPGVEEQLKAKYTQLISHSNENEIPLSLLNAIESFEYIEPRYLINRLVGRNIDIDSDYSVEATVAAQTRNTLEVKDRELMTFFEDRLSPFSSINLIRPNPVGNFRAPYHTTKDLPDQRRKFRSRQKRLLKRGIPG